MKDIRNHNQRLAVRLVHNADYEGLVKLFDDGLFDETLLETIPAADGAYFPIYWLTLCVDIILGDPEQWKDKERARLMKKNNQLILELLKSRCGIDIKPVDFYNIEIPFYRSEPDETIDDVFCPDTEELVGRNRPIDVDLFVAAQKFDFVKVKELLEAGANPEADFATKEEKEENADDMEDGEEYTYSILNRIGHENMFLTTEYMPVKIHKYLDERDLQNIVGYAAHEKMWDLLYEYCEK